MLTQRIHHVTDCFTVKLVTRAR